MQETGICHFLLNIFFKDFYRRNMKTSDCENQSNEFWVKSKNIFILFFTKGLKTIFTALKETKLFIQPNVSAASNNLESSIPLSPPGRNPEIDLNILFSHFPSTCEYHIVN